MAFDMRSLTGTMLGRRYFVGEVARQTRASTRFRGEDTRTGVAVHIDVVREPRAGVDDARMGELDAMTSFHVRHPNVVTPRDIGLLAGGAPYVITDAQPGQTLEERVTGRGALPIADVVRIGLELLSALAAAHDLGVVHGDLRPDSLFLVERDGLVLQTLLSGFGGSSRADASPAVGFGSLAFVAPEVAAGGAPTFVSDLYACGAVLYLAASGFPPYSPHAASLTQLLLDGPAAAPASLRPGLPARLVRVLVEALQTSPARRYASAREMLEALELVRGGSATEDTRPRAERDTFTTMRMMRAASVSAGASR